MATRRGVVKKTPLVDYSRPKQGGIIGISLDEGDALIGVALVREGDEVMLSTRLGMAIRFDQSQARAMGRNTRGVRGIDLQDGDEVVGMVVADPAGYLLTVCENGYGKRTPFGPNTAGDEAAEEEAAEPVEVAEEPAVEDGENGEPRDRSSMRYRKQRRGGKGVRDIRTTGRNGPVVAVSAVREGDDIMLITAQGMVNRTHVDEVRIVGRNTQGVRIINLSEREGGERDKVAALAKVAREDIAEEEVVGEAPPEVIGPVGG
jgi:DNA gyrase subunit A